MIIGLGLVVCTGCLVIQMTWVWLNSVEPVHASSSNSFIGIGAVLFTAQYTAQSGSIAAIHTAGPLVIPTLLYYSMQYWKWILYKNCEFVENSVIIHWSTQ